MQLSSLEAEVLSVIARVELAFGRMARFDTADYRRVCRSLDDLGLIATTHGDGSTVACMRDAGREELGERGFYDQEPRRAANG